MSESSLKQKPRISLAPLTHINAITDTKTSQIFLSHKAFVSKKCNDILVDELAHLVSGDASHGEEWQDCCNNLYDSVPTHNPEFDGLKRRLGIPEYIGANIGNITGIQNVLTDYHLLQQYRRFSQKILGTEGHWEVLGDNRIRLYPTPRGTFPVVVLYVPVITRFRSPQARLLAMDMLVAESKIMLGNARAKFSSIPSPDGGSLTLDGDTLRQQGEEEREKIVEKANLLAEPLPVLKW